MNRFVALSACSFVAFGIMLALLLVGSRLIENPMDAGTALILAAMLAPLFGWRFERLMMETANSIFQQGGYRAATLPGPVIGVAVQTLARLTPGDFSLLVMAIRHEGPEPMHVMTARGSDNYRIWTTFANLGLMCEIAAEPEVTERLPYKSHRFYLTPKGKQLIPPLLHAASVIRRSVPELT